MARLIEIQDAVNCPIALSVETGDMLLFTAIGGRIRSGAEFMQLQGPFVPAVVGDTGEILTAMGSPNTILFRALQAGRGTIEVLTGEMFQPPTTTVIEITVADP